MKKLLACVLPALLLASTARGAVRDDRFMAGYVTAVIERELELRVAEVRVEGGVASILLEDPGGESIARVAQVVARIPGIQRVEVRVVGDDDAPAVRDSAGGDSAGGEGDGGEAAGGAGWTVHLLPRHELFAPLLADPQEPHFSALYQWYLNDEELTHVGSANAGETFALLGGEVGAAGWQVGLMGGVFSIFDLDAKSQDLLNADYLVAPTLSLRRGRWSGQVRLYHQSSHLGDEFLLHNSADPVNLSYEGVDLLLSADVHSAVRLYVGGGRILHSDPFLHPLSAQGGIELRSPITFLEELVRPVVSFDFQAREQNQWRGEYSVVWGIELANPDLSALRLMLLASYFNGNSPNGQFFRRRIEYLGIGAHLYF